jgi:hypothetical protein
MRLREWQYMNPPAKPATKAASKTNKEKFADLIDYIIKHKPDYTTDTDVDRLDDSGFEYEEHRALGDIALDYDIGVEVSLGKNDLFTIHVFKDGALIETIVAKGWEEFLRYLKTYFNTPKTGSPEHTALIESYVADELFENLF